MSATDVLNKYDTLKRYVYFQLDSLILVNKRDNSIKQNTIFLLFLLQLLHCFVISYIY
jgi:hypothetical protein